ncbi:AMP-binding protein, partial [Streptomyces qinglanensis]|uniref:AMP-binding protein n=1 Tax=Streptomyces qinglanensis TaxID=943816 RepID=UPI003D75DEF1
MEYNLADLFESVVDTVPDREALVHLDHPGTGAERRLTYAGLDRAANRLAHHFTSSGVRPGEHVGLHLYNGVEYVQTLLACLKIRAVPVNVNYRYVEGELVHLYRDADLAALVFDGEFTARVRASAPRAPKLRHLVRVGGGPDPCLPAPRGRAAPPTFAEFAEAEAAGSGGRGGGGGGG